MTDYPYIENKDKLGYYTLHLAPDHKIKMVASQLNALYILLSGFKEGVQLGKYNLNGLVTVEQGQQEIIFGWYGGYSTARYLADKMVKDGKTTGARAYACIGEFGRYERETITDPDSDDTEICPIKNTTLDTWGII